MSTNIAITIGITGHRDILPIDHNRIAREFSSLIDQYEKDYPHLAIRVLTGMAVGSDQLIAETCLKRMSTNQNLELIAVLPMPIEEYRRDFKSHEVGKFEQLIGHIKNSKNSTVIELPSQHDRVDCYSQLGRYLTNKSDVLIAIWDGEDKEDVGGTCHVVKSALPLENQLHQKDFSLVSRNQVNNFLYSGSGCPVYRIYAKRESRQDKQDSNTDNGYITSYQANNLTLIDVSSNLSHLACLNKISQAVSKTKNKNSEAIKGYLCDDDSYIEYTNQSSDLKRTAQLFGIFDATANRLKKKLNIIHNIVAVITIILTATFLAYAKLFPNLYLLAAYLFIFIGAYAWYKLSKPNKLKTEFTLYRTIAESLRIEFFWRAKGLIDPIGESSLVSNGYVEASDEISAVKSVLKQATLLGKQTKERYFSNKNISQNWILDQRNYYEKQSSKLKNKLHKIELVVSASIYVPIALCLALLLFYTEIKEFTLYDVSGKNIIVFLVGFIPILGAVFELNISNNSIKELSEQYASTAKYLSNVHSLISNLEEKENNCDKIIEDCFRTAGIELSREHIAWFTTTKQKSIEIAHGG